MPTPEQVTAYKKITDELKEVEKTIKALEEQRDSSAQTRLDMTRACGRKAELLTTIASITKPAPAPASAPTPANKAPSIASEIYKLQREVSQARLITFLGDFARVFGSGAPNNTMSAAPIANPRRTAATTTTASEDEGPSAPRP